MIDNYPCLQIKILLRILFSQHNFVGILIFYQNFVSYRHHSLRLPLSRYQNSASNFAFPAEFCQNSDITAEFRFIQTSLSTSPLVSKSKFCFEFCFLRRILSELWYHTRILFYTDIIVYTCHCLHIKILLGILLLQQNSDITAEFRITQTSWSTSTVVSKSKFCLEFCFHSRILSEFWYHSRIFFHTDSIVYTSPYLDIKILLRILLFQQNFVTILIFYENFVWYRHHNRQQPLSWNQNSA